MTVVLSNGTCSSCLCWVVSQLKATFLHSLFLSDTKCICLSIFSTTSTTPSIIAIVLISFIIAQCGASNCSAICILVLKLPKSSNLIAGFDGQLKTCHRISLNVTSTIFLLESGTRFEA